MNSQVSVETARAAPRSQPRFVLGSAAGLVEALQGELTPKFLATRSAGGVPNLVPLTSMTAAADADDTLHFGNFLLRKSVVNLGEDCRVGMLVVTPELSWWSMTGDFEAFLTEGPYADRQRNASLLRYNAYTGIRNAGVIRARTMARAAQIGKAALVREYGLARAASVRPPGEEGIRIPREVRKQLARMVAVKALAWVDGDGWPRVVPALSAQPAGASSLLVWMGSAKDRPADGSPVAINLLTLEAISYQVKGIWRERARYGVVVPTAVYAGGPPLPGGQIA